MTKIELNELFSKSLTETVYDSYNWRISNKFPSLYKIYNILYTKVDVDMTREDFLEWRMVWRQAYREITRTSRTLKLHRKESFLKRHYKMEREQYGMAAGLRAMEVYRLKHLATIMLSMRQAVKDRYNERVRTVHLHEERLEVAHTG